MNGTERNRKKDLRLISMPDLCSKLVPFIKYIIIFLFYKIGYPFAKSHSRVNSPLQANSGFNKNVQDQGY